MKRKVFILNDGGHDYSSAEAFGELVICTDESIRKDDIAQMYRVLSSVLAGADVKDLILVSSLSSMCMVAAAIMTELHGELHMLVYKEGKYVERSVILS